jgi:hypothetical protein
MITALCRSCGTPIYWLRHHVTGKLAPIDIEEGFGGNITIDLDAAEYTIVPKGSSPSPNRHRNHFATCPQAAKHHKTKVSTAGRKGG